MKLCLMWNDAVSSCTPSYGCEEGYWVLLAGGESWLHPYVATRPPQLPSESILQWADHSEDTASKDKMIGKYREIVTERIVRRGVNRAERTRRGTIVGMVFRSLTLAFTVGGGMSQKSISFFDNIRLPQINCRCSTWTWCFLVLTRMCFPRSRVCVWGERELI